MFNALVTNIKIERMPWLFRVVLSKSALIEYDISMLSIKISFINFWNKNFSDIKIIKGKQMKEIINNVLNVSILSNNINSAEPVINFRFDLKQVNTKILDDLRDLLIHKFNIKGSKNIKTDCEIVERNYYTFDNSEQKYEEKKEYIVYCNGIDMNTILNMKVIDIHNTKINDLNTIYRLYGIEAARAFLIRDIGHFYEKGDFPINYHHISLLADMMTATGGITSIDRHGINKTDSDPLSKASFETPLDKFVKAAVFNETDAMRSVSSQIMVGKTFKGGTGLCTLILDHDMLNNISYTEASKSYITKTIQLTSNELIDEIINQ
jgi:DNA-directed RNA polymerase II subunit RPB1